MGVPKEIINTSTPLEAIVYNIDKINENLSVIAEALYENNFWDSQWFAALIGDSAAVAVFSIEKLFLWRRRKSEKLVDLAKWLNVQWIFRSPGDLLKSARSSGYGYTKTEGKTGKKEVVLDKPLGEKMVITLRRDLKYWRYPGWRFRRLFRKYEKSLQAFDMLKDGDKEEQDRLLAQAKIYFEKIDNLAFKITGDNEWTAM